MGGREPDTKVPKASAVQEQSPSKITCSGAAAYPDWSWFQAYSPMFPHGFFHSPMASSAQTHPFMWGAQHFMPPYGTPAPPYVMYPHGVYAHPSVQTCSVPSSTEADAKSSVSKEKNRPQKSKERSGSLNIFTGNENNLDKTSGAPNGVFSQSGDNGSEDSTEGSGANFRNDLEAKMGDRQESLDETSQNDTRGTTIAPTRSTSYHTMPMMPMPAAAAPGVVARPTANLNIGMEYWVSSTSSAIPPINGKVPATVSAGTVVPGALVGANEKVPPEIWLQDERELKRHRRKQSNRESARRSRLRKQAEYEELAQRVEVLKEENTALRTEVERIKKEFNELLAQNASLQERIEEETVEEGSIIEKSGLLVESGAVRTVNSDS